MQYRIELRNAYGAYADTATSQAMADVALRTMDTSTCKGFMAALRACQAGDASDVAFSLPSKLRTKSCMPAPRKHSTEHVDMHRREKAARPKDLRGTTSSSSSKEVKARARRDVLTEILWEIFKTIPTL